MFKFTRAEIKTFEFTRVGMEMFKFAIENKTNAGFRGVVQALFGVQKWCYEAKNKILQNCS